MRATSTPARDVTSALLRDWSLPKATESKYTESKYTESKYGRGPVLVVGGA